VVITTRTLFFKFLFNKVGLLLNPLSPMYYIVQHCIFCSSFCNLLQSWSITCTS